jgi:SAM-dependent methyltransferase
VLVAESAASMPQLFGRRGLAERLARIESLFIVTERALIRGKYRALDALYAMTLPQRVLRCPICAYEAMRETFATRMSECQFGGGRLERYDCPRCGAVFGPMKMLDMAPDELQDEYRLLYETYAEADPTERELRTFASLQPTRGARYVNWGSGVRSSSTAILRRRRFQVWGYEPTAEKNRRFVVNALDQIPRPLDGIFSNNVIEHFLDPVQAFAEFASLLKPGGLMAHSTACYEYDYYNTRFHTVFFLGDSVRVLCERTGFEFVSREDDGDYINVVFRKSTPKSAQASS